MMTLYVASQLVSGRSLMMALMALFRVPIFLLNAFGLVVSGVWLLAIGEWRAVLLGLVTMLVAPFLLGLALLPVAAIGAAGIYFAKRGLTIGLYVVGLLASIYTYVLIGGWCGGVVFQYMQNAAPKSFWPLLIWSYGVATSPWSYLAKRDQALPSFLAAFFAQVAFIILIIAIASGVHLNDALQIFALVLIVGVVFHMRLLAQASQAGFLDVQ
jgi:hypothetical protein